MRPTDEEKEPIEGSAVAPEGAAGEGESSDYPVTQDFIDQVADALEAGDAALARSLTEPLHAADFADLLSFLEPAERPALVAAYGRDFDPEILSELDETLRAEIVDSLQADEIAAAVSQLDTDDAVYILEDLDEDRRQEVLEVIPSEDRAALEEGLSYPEDSAGRLMRRELVAVPQFWNVGQTIDHLREHDDLPDDFHEIFIVDPRYHPVGTVPLNRVMRAKRDVLMQELMEEGQRLLPVVMDQEEVAFIFKQYNLMSAAVVDIEGRLVGVITIDDVVDVIHEEADEDIRLLAGVGDEDMHESVLSVSRTRLPWLFVNLGTAILAASVIALFDASIEQLVALAVLMPIVASMGGNAGTQTMTVTVRALAMRSLMPSNSRRVFNREVRVNFLNGSILAAVIGCLAALWFGDPLLGAVLASALVINLLVAGFFGVFIPLTLHRLGVDPAVASSVFLTTITDVIGFFVFLGLAAWIIL